MTAVATTSDILPATGYFGKLNREEQTVLADLKRLLLDKHGIGSEASHVEDRFRLQEYADPVIRYDLELL